MSADLVEDVEAHPTGTFGEWETLDWLDKLGLVTVPRCLVVSPQTAVSAAQDLGYPVVAKISSPDVLHKSDSNGVIVGLRDDAAVHAAFVELQTRHTDRFGHPGAGVIIESMLEGVELILGITRDAALGPFVLCGFGGVLAELIDDTVVIPAPVDEATAAKLLGSLRANVLLDGYRSGPAVDRSGIVTLIVQVSEIAARHSEVRELDLNPIIVTSRGPVAVDARMVVDLPRPSGESPLLHRLPNELFEPASIAVIGASRDGHKPGGRVMRYLLEHGYTGRIVPVNAGATEVQGLPAVASVSDLDCGSIDLACIAVPADVVAKTLEDCIAADIPAAIVFGAGFGESGVEGIRRQNEVDRVTLSSTGPRIRYVGPNSNGVISTDPPVHAAIGMVLELSPIEEGRIALVSQSGAIGSCLMSRSWDENTGFSRWISTGNEANIDLSEYVNYLADDDHTDVILLFVEAIRDGRRFAAAAERCRLAGKPIVAYKTGRTVVGRRATASHTGALAGDDRLYNAFFEQTGVLRVQSLEALLDAGRVLATTQPAEGDRIAVVTMSGGVASVVADGCATAGLNLPQFSAELQVSLTDIVPGFGSVANPLDVTATAITSPSILVDCIERIVTSSEIDLVLVQLTTNAEPSASVIAVSLTGLLGRISKPILVGRLGSPRLAPEAMRIYREAKIPILDTPERLVDVARLVVAQSWMRRRQ